MYWPAWAQSTEVADLPLTLIAAVARNGVIGDGRGMPWHLLGDLAHFRTNTLGRPVLMGRKTFDSIGGPLPGRPVVVLSRDTGFEPGQGVTVARSLPEAVARSREIGAAMGAPEIMVAGGGTIYAATLPMADTLLLTEVDIEAEGDTKFPLIDPQVWREVERRSAPQRPDDMAPYAFVRMTRRHPP